MSLLLHVCCAPCLIYPAKVLKNQNYEFSCYFYNPNIHPYTEFRKRLNCLIEFAQERGISLITEKDYGLRQFLRSVVFNETNRCNFCYTSRITHTVTKAKKMNFSSFSSTLLYSKYQRHELIKEISTRLSAEYSVPFHYEDYRNGWQKGIDEAISHSLYRQKYCGCIYSEQERFDNRFKKKLKKGLV